MPRDVRARAATRACARPAACSCRCQPGRNTCVPGPGSLFLPGPDPAEPGAAITRSCRNPVGQEPGPAGTRILQKMHPRHVVCDGRGWTGSHPAGLAPGGRYDRIDGVHAAPALRTQPVPIATRLLLARCRPQDGSASGHSVLPVHELQDAVPGAGPRPRGAEPRPPGCRALAPGPPSHGLHVAPTPAPTSRRATAPVPTLPTLARGPRQPTARGGGTGRSGICGRNHEQTF